MKTIKLFSTSAFALAVAVGLGVNAKAQNTIDSFTNANGDGSYKEGANWSTGAVPNLTTATTAAIDDGAAVTYTPGGDLLISNGGELEIGNGSFTQTSGTNYLQLGAQGSGAGTGNGTILVDGGTFNQGTVTSNPFNITGTGNLFEITSGAANFNRSIGLNPGLTYLQTGGTVTQSAGEFDFNYLNSGTISGGTLNVGLVTGQNHAAGATVDDFNVSGGTINITGNTGIYGAGVTQYVNYTAGSSGVVDFSGGLALSAVEGFITGGGIEDQSDGADKSTFTTVGLPLGGIAEDDDFLITGVPDTTTIGQTDYEVSLIGAAVAPEPSTYLMMGLGLVALARFRKHFAKIG
jgi:hypothetical protein